MCVIAYQKGEIEWGVLFRRGRFAYAEYSEYSFPLSLEEKSNRQWEYSRPHMWDKKEKGVMF